MTNDSSSTTTTVTSECHDESHDTPCRFNSEEQTQLRIIASRTEYVGFPKWALAALIAILAGLATSNTAIWISLSSKVASDELATVQSQLSEMKALVPKEYPPVWFQKQFDALVLRADANGIMLSELRVKVERIITTQEATATALTLKEKTE